MSPTDELHADQLKPHVKELLDQVRRVGLDGARLAHYKIEADLKRAQQEVLNYHEGSVKEDDRPAQSCSALLVLSAVAFQIYQDMSDDPDAALPYLLDAADYYLAAVDQGCV